MHPRHPAKQRLILCHLRRLNRINAEQPCSGQLCAVAVRKDGSHEEMLALSNATAGAVTGFWVAMAFGVLYAVGYFVAMCLRNMHLDAIAQPTPYSAYSTHGLSFTTPYFMYLFPILACISFSDSSLYERNNHLLAPLLGKMGIGRYYRSKLVAVFCGGFLPIFATQALNMGLCLIAFPLNGTQRYGWDLFQDYTYWYHVSDPHFFFQRLYLYSPYLYYLLYMLLSALVAGLFAVAAWQFPFSFATVFSPTPSCFWWYRVLNIC